MIAGSRKYKFLRSAEGGTERQFDFRIRQEKEERGLHLQKKEEIVPKNAKRGKQRKEKSCKRAKKKTVGSVRFST